MQHFPNLFYQWTHFFKVKFTGLVKLSPLEMLFHIIGLWSDWGREPAKKQCHSCFTVRPASAPTLLKPTTTAPLSSPDEGRVLCLVLPTLGTPLLSKQQQDPKPWHVGPRREQATDSHFSLTFYYTSQWFWNILRSWSHLEMCCELWIVFLGRSMGRRGAHRLIICIIVSRDFRNLLRPIDGILARTHIGPLVPLMGHRHFS